MCLMPADSLKSSYCTCTVAAKTKRASNNAKPGCVHFILSMLQVYLLSVRWNPPENLSAFTQVEFKVTEVNYMQSRYW